MNRYIFLYIFICILIVLSFFVLIFNYNNFQSNNDQIIRNLEKEIKKLQKDKYKNIIDNDKPIKQSCEIIPKDTRCCPDIKYSIYEDNPWIYSKNPYIDSNTTYDINWYRRDGPKLPNRVSYPSQYDTCEFKQVGVLSPLCNQCGEANNCNDCVQKEILPLYAKPSKYNRNNYNYYTVNNGNQNLNLQVPVEYKNKNCMENNGCNELFDKDIIKVPVFNKNYEITMYPSN